MRTTRKFHLVPTSIMEKLLRTLMFLVMAMCCLLLTMGLFACSKSDPTSPDQDPIEGGKITGSVEDEQGNPYPGTKITLSKGSETVTRTTNAEGVYIINTKEIGSYELTVVLPLSTELVGNVPSSVNVKAEQTNTLDFVIQTQSVKAHLNFGDVQLLEEIVDKDGNTPTDPNEPLYAANIFDEPLGMLTAIKAPDDHHVTLAEFKQAKGNLMVYCNGDAASIEVELEGLIPNGTYTFWLAYLNKTRKVSEPIDFANDFVNFTNPPVGASDGTENIAIADSNGSINTTLSHDSCILTDETALVIPVLYHINGKTFGGGHVPDTEETVQLLVYFQ